MRLGLKKHLVFQVVRGNIERVFKGKINKVGLQWREYISNRAEDEPRAKITYLP